MSARVEPSQSRWASPEALRNGRIASETCGPAGVDADGGFLPNLPVKAHPAKASATARAATATHFHGTFRLPTITVVGEGVDAPTGRLPCQASKSARIS